AVRPPPNGTPPPGGIPFGRCLRPARGGPRALGHRDGRSPVRAFVVASHPAPPRHANGVTTALPPRRPAPAGSYSPPAPIARRLKPPETSPGTGGTTAGRQATSQVSVERPSASHVARDEPRVRWCAAGSPADTVCGRAVITPRGRF